MAKQPVLEPDVRDTSGGSGRWQVVIFDNDVTPLDLVIDILIRATGCGLREASIETWEAQEYGKAPVHFAAKEECDSIATIISSIGVKTEVSQEWES